MFDLVLHQPEIAPNTGNLMRLSVNTGCRLHLVHPLGFTLDDARVRRAGLDYRERATVTEHAGFEEMLAAVDPPRLFAFTGRGDLRYDTVDYTSGDALLFGRESVGLPAEVLTHPAVTATVRIPIAPQGRSLNLANAVAVVVYEGWRRLGFPGAK
ncbi:MAG: tRNA (cytidine(34)-2'-O)-methyltransferase, partial [Actinomycetota bacterium]|nr:tRNA (cytidine(34)-2'-O)-methyltransferase [Actinomycetota bacterium]